MSVEAPVGRRKFRKRWDFWWTYDVTRALRGKLAHQAVMNYVTSCPACNDIGLYDLSLATLCHDVGIAREEAWEILADLADLGFCFYDGDREEIFIPIMARWEHLEGPPRTCLHPRDNNVRHIHMELWKHRESPFVWYFYELYHEAFYLPREWAHPGDWRPPESPGAAPPAAPLPRGCEAPSQAPVNGMESGRQDAIPPLAAPSQPLVEPLVRQEHEHEYENENDTDSDRTIFSMNGNGTGSDSDHRTRPLRQAAAFRPTRAHCPPRPRQSVAVGEQYTVVPLGTEGPWPSVQAFVHAYNLTIPEEWPLVRDQDLSAELVEAIRAALTRHPDKRFWDTVFHQVELSLYLRGQSKLGRPTNMRPGIGWLVGYGVRDGEENAIKIYRGDYAPGKLRRESGARPAQADRSAWWAMRCPHCGARLPQHGHRRADNRHLTGGDGG